MLTTASSDDVFRLVSWLYTAKCLTWAIVPVDWTPWMSAAPMVPFRYGSSPTDSNARPHRGSRTMLIVGPRSTVVPLLACSDPMTCPYSFSAPVSQVAATSTGAGSWVTLLIPSPTPAGPSSRFMAGMQSDPMAGVNPT